MGVLEPIVSVDHLVQSLGLSILAEPGDLAVENGNIKQTRDNDLFWGPDAAYNAMWRLTTAWSFASPTLLLFANSIESLRNEQRQLEQEIEQLHSGGLIFGPSAASSKRLAVYHRANEALTAGAIGASAISGSLLVLASSYLGRFRADLKPDDPLWAASEPHINAISAGRLIVAAANAFRHADEWAEARASNSFSRQQRISRDVLEAALLHGDPDISPWEHAYRALSQGTGVEGLGRSVLTFAHNVALEMRRRG